MASKLIRCIPALLFLLLAACSDDDQNVRAEQETSRIERQALSLEFLLSGSSLDNPVNTSAFRASTDGKSLHRFEGRLEMFPVPGQGQLLKQLDWFDYLDDSSLSIADLPPFSFEFVQNENELIPVSRGPQASSHPHWELILEPGRVWDEPGDRGWTRASLPFSLQERNANCTHNGLLTFVFKASGEVSRVAYQVGSETCQYLQIDLWGVLDARYIPGKVREAETVIHDHRESVDARLPVKSIEAIAEDYPGADPGGFDWYPPGEASTFGFAIDGVHYSGGCATRYGPYPYCEVLDLPSYSLAKSIFAGTALMVLEQAFPGVGELRVDQLVPECSGERWEGVTLQHLADMSSGNFESLEPNADEFASYETDFMAGETHAQKINTACKLFPRNAEPGSVFAYHTSDTYIAGTVMNAFLARQNAAGKSAARDIHSDVLVKEVMKPLKLSPVTWHSRRSYDEIAQPFAGYGLTLHADDIVRFGLFLAQGDGVIQGRQVLSNEELSAALQRNSNDRGVKAGSEKLRYNNGFWGFLTDLDGTCNEPVWLPVMSGYGGISVVILPNRSLFYVFSDHGRFEWLKAAIESNSISNYCENNATFQ
jgi:hypothetical protein